MSLIRSMEYLSSGPDHFELTGHIDDGDGGDPVLLDYWRGTHYGGSVLNIAAGEDWNKVVGPIFLYVDSGATPDDMFSAAKQQAAVEIRRWPYSWVQGVDYPHAAQRATVTGRIVLDDAQAATTRLPDLLVGLTAPESVAPAAEDTDSRGHYEQPVTWQNDAKHYEFWTRGASDGRFSIPNVRPGTYVLHAIADGVLGQFTGQQVVVGEGGQVHLGKLTWKPVRYGRQLWQIGIPNRAASEFLLGNDHWHWGLYIKYSQLFPHDVNYTIGKSDFHKDWFIYQVPHVIEDDGRGRSQGRATPWTVHFVMPRSSGAELDRTAVLRLGISGVAARTIAVSVNGQPAGIVDGLTYNATINRDGVEGSWVEKDLRFLASMMHAGENTLTLTVPAGGLTSGIAYDVVRLELAPKSP